MLPQNILIVSVKKIAAFFSFCLFKLLNKIMVMPQALEKFYGTGKNIGKTSYLLSYLFSFVLTPYSKEINH